MIKRLKSENVPKTLKDRFIEISEITDKFSAEYLTIEYAQLIRFAIAALCRKRPSPLLKGRASTWACGITHAIGIINFLFDRSQAPHISAGKLYKVFGVGESTGQSKSKLIREQLKMSSFDSNWMLPSRIESNPFSWMISPDLPQSGYYALC